MDEGYDYPTKEDVNLREIISQEEGKDEEYTHTREENTTKLVLNNRNQKNEHNKYKEAPTEEVVMYKIVDHKITRNNRDRDANVG